MNILQINEKVDSGGSAISMMLLHRTLRAMGHDAHVLAARKADGIEGFHLLQPPSVLSRVCFHALNLAGLNFAGLLGVRRIVGAPSFAAADVVQLQNLHGGYFNYRWLPAIARLKPVVWTLRDMWALTGHCAHSFECSRWQTGCGRCPHPDIYPAIRRDATHWEWRIKRRVYTGARITIVCPSAWLAGLARQSPLLGHMDIRHVNNGVDTSVFRPTSQEEARRVLRLPAGRKILLFAADRLDNPFKDFGLLLRALEGLPAHFREEVTLLTLGHGSPQAPRLAQFETRPMGYVADGATMATLLNAADLFAYPSRADNQPRGILESMACGCPVAATAVGGIPELVLTGRTGWLVPAGDATAFSEALRQGLELKPEQRASFRETAVRKIAEDHDAGRNAAAMLDIYRQAIEKFRQRTDT